MPELSKMSALVKHYQFHQQENPDISIFSFFNLHYCDVQHMTKYHNDHEDLPFHYDDCYAMFAGHKFEPVTSFSLSESITVTEITKGPRTGNFFSRDILINIFQPPRC
jgi:hypothetical protein